jgi:hypothetical protein
MLTTRARRRGHRKWTGPVQGGDVSGVLMGIAALGLFAPMDTHKSGRAQSRSTDFTLMDPVTRSFDLSPVTCDASPVTCEHPELGRTVPMHRVGKGRSKDRAVPFTDAVRQHCATGSVRSLRAKFGAAGSQRRYLDSDREAGQPLACPERSPPKSVLLHARRPSASSISR